MSENFTNEYINDTYQKVLHISDNGYLVNGTGSLVNLLKTTTQYSVTSSYAIGYVPETEYLISSSSFDYRIKQLTGSIGTQFWDRIPGALYPSNINDKVGIGLVPSAFLHLVGGNTTTPSLRLAPGTLTTLPLGGAIEYDGVDLYFTKE